MAIPRDPIRELADMTERNPEVARLLERICELDSDGLDALLVMWEKRLWIQSEQRAPFHVLDGGKV